MESDPLTDMGRHRVPAAWRRILPEELFWARAPEERLATCASCYKVTRGEFRPDCQCCTYFPQIPNFMLGLALRDPRSREGVVRVIDGGHTLPLGMIASPEKLRAAAAAYTKDLFGRDPAMRCPFVEPETFDCSLYPYRNSICSTFFCAHDHGEAGELYWNKVQALVGHVEVALSQWTLDRVGLPAVEVLSRLDAWADQVPESFDGAGGWSPGLRRHVWGSWYGRERELFDACADLVMSHDPSRDDLFQAACDQPFLEPLVFDRAVRAWVPEAYRDAVPEVAGEQGATPLATRWYELQLAVRRLWELPFNEGRVVRDPGADPPRPLSAAEADVLSLFETPRVLGEELFQRAEIEALADARGFLAECLRRGILTAV